MFSKIDKIEYFLPKRKKITSNEKLEDIQGLALSIARDKDGCEIKTEMEYNDS